LTVFTGEDTSGVPCVNVAHIGQEQAGNARSYGDEAWHGELMIMILPGDLAARAARIPPGPAISAPVNCPGLSGIRTGRRSGGLARPRCPRTPCQRTARWRPPGMGRPGSRPAPATRRLASWRREAARRGCRQRAAAAGQARHGPARRQSPHQIPDLPRGTRRYRRYGRRQAGVQAEALEDSGRPG
jgi:hypothetical protein